jgi:aspartate carbamoyltransferase catalytic subunit
VRITRVSCGAEKRSSDGDYGNEMAKAELFADLEPGEDPHAVLDTLLGMVRLQLERDLSQSAALKVRRSVIRQVRRCSRCQEPLADDENSYMHPACREAEDAEREARYQEQKRRYEQAEEEQLAGVGASDDDDDDEDLPL